MNILQVLPELRVGGVETGTVDLAGELVKLGHKAVVVSFGGQLVKDLEPLGATHYQLPVHKKSIFTMAKMVRELVKIIKKENIDIVHARSRVPAWPAYFACLLTKRVFITTCHGYYSRHLFSYVMSWGKRVIVLSNVIARHMIDDFGTPHDRIRLIPRSVDTSKFKYLNPESKRREEFNVGIIGRLTPLKGHMDFIKAMHKVLKRVPGLKVWIVGDAPASKEDYKEQLEVLVKRLGLAGHTQFLGTQRDIPYILSGLDVLVLSTTTQEAFGRVVIEAQASGVPVVATKVGGVIDIIDDGATGLLVPPSDPDSISNAVVKIYNDKNLARRMSEAALAKVKEKYTLEIMVNKTVEVYTEALSTFKILVIKFSSVGDVVLSTAAIRAIRNKFPPNHKITFLVGEESKEVLLRCPYIDDLMVCDLKNRDKGFSGLMKLGGLLRKKGFDMVIDLQNNRKSHLLSGLTMANDRYGYQNKKWSFFLNHKVEDDLSPIAPVAHQFRILKMLGIDLRSPDLELWPCESDERYIKDLLSAEWLSDKQKIVGINIGASLRWKAKNLSLPHLVKLCEELGAHKMRIVITGTQYDYDLGMALSTAVKNTKIINACGKTTMNQLACLIKQCGVFISGDSAPLHVASAVKTPFVAIFGPTDPRRHLPPAEKFVLLQSDLPCSPCYKANCKKAQCVAGVSVAEIVSAVDKLLK